MQWVQFLIFFRVKKLFCNSMGTIVFPVHVKIFTNTGDIGSLKINDELERSVVIVGKKKDFLV